MKEDLLSIRNRSLPAWNRTNNSMNTGTKTRDYLFDNYKVFLIFLVVVGHFVGPSVSKNTFLMVLKWIIVSFHMPAFIFISGYFAKRDLPFLTVVKKLAIPYIAYEILYYLWYVFIVHKDTGLRLLKPKFTLWYLFALFLWRVVTPYVRKIPGHLVLAFIAGFLIGFSIMENNYLTIPRALVYYPFYLAGVSFDRELLNKFRNKNGRILAIGIIVIIITLLAFIGINKLAPMQIFYGRYNYTSMKLGSLEGLFWRLILYVFGFLMTFAVMILMTDKKLSFSYIGTRTMGIYLFHGLLYTYLENATTILNNRNTFGETILLLGFCVLITLLFSLKPFNDFTCFFGNINLSHKKWTAR